MTAPPPPGPAMPVRGLQVPSWSERALLLLSSPSGEQTTIVEGPLSQVTKALAGRRPRWAGLSISLPDSQIEPCSYGSEALADLVLAWTIARDARSPSRRRPIVE
jgi:hypothetical protein